MEVIEWKPEASTLDLIVSVSMVNLASHIDEAALVHFPMNTTMRSNQKPKPSQDAGTQTWVSLVNKVEEVLWTATCRGCETVIDAGENAEFDEVVDNDGNIHDTGKENQCTEKEIDVDDDDVNALSSLEAVNEEKMDVCMIEQCVQFMMWTTVYSVSGYMINDHAPIDNLEVYNVPSSESEKHVENVVTESRMMCSVVIAHIMMIMWWSWHNVAQAIHASVEEHGLDCMSIERGGARRWRLRKGVTVDSGAANNVMPRQMCAIL